MTVVGSTLHISTHHFAMQRNPAEGEQNGNFIRQNTKDVVPKNDKDADRKLQKGKATRAWRKC